MSPQILLLKSSPRPHGNSNTLADRLAEGARHAGAQVETISLHDLHIHPCDACDFCTDTGGVCVLKDDMQLIYPKLIQANVIVLASPIYWFTFSAQLKLCIDRWYALETPHGNQLRGKRIAILLTYADTDEYTSGAINAIHTFQSMFGYLGCEIAGIIHGSASEAGEILQKPILLDQAYRLGETLARE